MNIEVPLAVMNKKKKPLRSEKEPFSARKVDQRSKSKKKVSSPLKSARKSVDK